MKGLATVLVLALLTRAAPSPDDAQAQPPGVADQPVRLAAAQSESLAEGEIRKIDPKTGKLTLKHGRIDTLNMPPMTMVFAVRNPAMLQGLQAGDKIRFKAVDENGQLIVTELHRQ